MIEELLAASNIVPSGTNGEAVSRIPGPEDDFINDFFFKDFPLSFLESPEHFPENG